MDPPTTSQGWFTYSSVTGAKLPLRKGWISSLGGTEWEASLFIIVISRFFYVLGEDILATWMLLLV
jgi:hypothetical protein